MGAKRTVSRELLYVGTEESNFLEGEQALAHDVILSALHDAAGVPMIAINVSGKTKKRKAGPPRDHSRARLVTKEQTEALEWILSEEDGPFPIGSFGFWCELLGVDPDKIRALVRSPRFVPIIIACKENRPGYRQRTGLKKMALAA